MGYVCTTEYRLNHTDMDFKDELKASALLGFLQEAAGASADELNFGYEALKEKDYGFITVATYCRVYHPIVREKMTVETWPLPPRHVFFERDYRVLGENGELCAAAATRWCLVKLSTFELLLPQALGEAHEKCPYNPEKSVVVPSWKIPRLDGEAGEVFCMRVGASQCDHFLHMNNTRYADFFMDCFSMDELASRPVKSFQINYTKQAKEGDLISFSRRDGENGASVCEARRSGELLTQFQINF